MDDLSPVKKQLVRAKRAWSLREPWNRHLEDAYTYCAPHRRGAGDGPKVDNERIFDMTATMALVYSAGNFKDDMFPSGQSKLELEPGPLFKSRLSRHEIKPFERILAATGDQIDPFFQLGSFDAGIEETFQDLMLSAGAIMPVAGNRNDPVFFANIPIDNLAPMGDAWGRFNFASWKQGFTFEQIKEGFPNGKYNQTFNDQLKDKPDGKTDLYQDFFKLANGQWRYVVYVEDADEFIVQDTYLTQPLALVRYSAAGGDMMGQGPVLLAMPSIKTLNKAQELALRSAAVQLLGIWGYRPGATFNPNTARIGAGEFWPMGSTGGVLGPDVQRLDPATGRMDIARMVVQGMRDDVKQALFGDQLPSDQGTPKSASEILARIQRQSKTNRIAYGRVSRETMPILVPRVAEILQKFDYLRTPLTLNEMVVGIKVRSPMQQAVDAGRLEGSLTYFDMVQAIAGPENVDEHLIADEMLGEARKLLDVPIDQVPTDQAKTQIRAQKQQQQEAMLAAQMALETAKVMPQPQPGVAA